MAWPLGALALLVGLLACNASGPQPERVTGGTQALNLGPDSNTILWSISGTVSNTNPNAWVAVRNGNDVLFVYGSNRFTFPTTYVNNTAYNVSVAGADPSLTCSIANNVGFIKTGVKSGP